MDQAIKSALNKYQGKESNVTLKPTVKSNLLTVVTVIIVIIVGFLFCAKHGYLNADKAWKAISDVPVGTTTVGQITDNIVGAFVKEKETTEPVNTTGQSGKIEASEVVSVIGAQYLTYSFQKLDYVQPVKGEITSGFGKRIHPVTGKESFHTGIDIAADLGTDISCFADGKVSEISQSKYYGNTVLITHGDKQTFYGHLNKVTVKEGENLNAGDSIGQVGSTGVSTGPHLHFEIWVNDEPVNPLEYINV